MVCYTKQTKLKLLCKRRPKSEVSLTKSKKGKRMKSKRVRGVEQRFRIESATSTYDRYSADFLSAGKFPCENDCYYVSDR